MDDLNYERVVNLHYQDLYRFAFSLVGTTDDASELTQETFSRLLSRGAQIQDPSKVKSWMFTTMYRIFLGARRRSRRYPEVPIDAAQDELPTLGPNAIEKIDSETVMAALLEIDENFRAPLLLFYVEQLSYREIAETLELPIGTVMSRLSRGKDLLRDRLIDQTLQRQSNIVPLRMVRDERSLQ